MKNPIVRLVIVFIVGIVVSRVFWLLGYFPHAFKYIIDPGSCSGLQVKTIAMYICSAGVALKMLIGPLIFMVVIFVFRKVIFKFVNQLRPKLPEDFRFLLNPLVATLIFTILWSGSHFETSDTMGIMGQKSFPTIVGVFTFITTEFYKLLQEKLANFFEKRDKYPKAILYMVAFLIPIFISFIITFQDRVTSVAVKEQSVVIISLICVYLALIPKKGSINLKQLK